MTQTANPKPVAKPAVYRTARQKNKTSLYSHGEPMVWLTGGALVTAIAMIIGILGLIVYQGMITFWPGPVVELKNRDGKVFMGEIARAEAYRPDPSILKKMNPQVAGLADKEMHENEGHLARTLYRTGNFDLTNEHFHWIDNVDVLEGSIQMPEWAMVIERQEWGRFYGFPKAFMVDGETKTDDPAEIWAMYNEHRDEVDELREKQHVLEKFTIGRINTRIEAARLAVRQATLRYGKDSPQAAKAAERATKIDADAVAEIKLKMVDLGELRTESARFVIVMQTATGEEKNIKMSDIVRMYPANQQGFFGKIGIYLSRWNEFLFSEPREANSEGGVWPAIFGTFVMTVLMSAAVVPLGVLAALYLREYAKPGLLVSIVRIAINNLAGVPSIVFGVFGLGFFCYIIGANIDQIFFEASLPNPTFGKGGLIWASLTLALLTLPVVIVATEEALSSVPGSMREGSYGCGASKWQTIQRIVLPRAMPGIMTGMILAMARGAGEVAPLMLVGAVKLAPDLAIDSVFPYFHPERSFMHLGFHIYDLGFQSPNSEAAKPMVYTTTLLLIVLVFALNIAAVYVRLQLKKRFVAQKF